MTGPRARTEWVCQQCGHAAPKWLGRCPSCGRYGSFVEERTGPSRLADPVESAVTPIALRAVQAGPAIRSATGLTELDRVLGGGLVRGSLVLLAGEPGIGKSTLLLQAACALSGQGARVLYVCGEESAEQVSLRGSRLGVSGDVLLLPRTSIGSVVNVAREVHPDVLIVDSIQTMRDEDLDGVPGSVGQVRACAAHLVRLAKVEGVSVIIVGHVTKEGTIAGPRVLEHMVDAVLSFEGDRDHLFRIVRATKNRFGSVSEIGVFEMCEDGLRGVQDPSGVLLAHREQDVSGTCVFAAVEGSRPMLVEVQALVTPTSLPAPRRLAVGIDTARVLQVLAVLERRAGRSFAQHDVYVAVAGGMRVSEPAVDLPLALALASALADEPLQRGCVAYGEIGLAGEVRAVPHAHARRAEAIRLGMSRIIAPRHPRACESDGVATLTQALVVLS